MEASAIQAGPGLGRPRIALGTPLLRLRSDQQLVALFREGNEEAFRVIHDRYRPRLLAYVRQMLPGRLGEVDDALQDVFVRTYAGLRTSNRAVALRPWLYRVAYNRCIDELRRPLPASELLEARDHVSGSDPAAETEQRESLRRLVVDIGRLPEQQRAALLMREMSGMAYADVASALGISVPAVKSLLVRARIGLAQALEARDTACVEIRHELAEAHEEGVRPSWMARRHLRDCTACRACRAEMRAQGRQVAALAPTFGPLAVLAKVLGIGTGAGGGTATAAGASGATAAGAGAASSFAALTVGHVATILAAAVVTAGGAVAVQQTVATHASHHAKHPTQTMASAASTAPAKSATLRMPALHPASPPAPGATQASLIQRGAPATSPSTAASTQWRPAGHQVPASTNNQEDITGVPSASASSTTCTPPPPPACTASATNTCPSDSGTSTSSSTPSSTGSTTTGTTTTAGSGSGSGSGSGTSEGGGGASSGTGSDNGTAAATGSSTGSAASAPTCQATTQPTSIQSTQPSGTGQTGTTQPAKQT